MIIDFHTHIFPDKLAKAAIEKIEGLTPTARAVIGGSESALRRSMKESGIDKCVILPVATRPGQFEHLNRYAAELNSRSEETGIISFGGIHPDDENPKEKIGYLKSLGIKGVKFHPDYQNCFIDDARYLKIISECVEQGLIVVTHSGVDPAVADMIRCTADRILRMYDSVFGRYFKGDSRFVLAHLGVNEMWEDSLGLLCGKNFYFDVSQGVGNPNVPPEVPRAIIAAHGADKILFGSDSPWRSQAASVREVENELGLSEDEKEKIFCKNAARLLNISL